MNENAKDSSDSTSRQIGPKRSGVNRHWSGSQLLRVGTWTEDSADSTSLLHGARGLSQNVRPGESQGHPTGHSLTCQAAAGLRASPRVFPQELAGSLHSTAACFPQSKDPKREARQKLDPFKALAWKSFVASLVPYNAVRRVTTLTQVPREGTETPGSCSVCHCENSQDGRAH